MSKTTAKTYPEPQRRRSGMKVSWNYYDSEADAKACSEAAKFNAVIYAEQGYDFGYQSPGSIRKIDGFGTNPDRWEVCLP